MTRRRATEAEAGTGPIPGTPDTQSPATGNGADPGHTPDPFDNLEALRLDQTFSRAKTRRPFTICQIRKPRPHEWFQAHPSFSFQTFLFKLKEGTREAWYWPTTPEVRAELEGRYLVPVYIAVWINRKSEVSIWPVQLQNDDGDWNDYHQSMHDVFTSHAYQGEWVRVQAVDGGYAIEVAENFVKQPEWPPVTLNEILRTAFKGGRVVQDLEHPLFDLLRGRD